MGFNEAMTEYLTQIRNNEFECNSDDLIANYRVVIEHLKKLMLIIGEEKLIKCFFYKPDCLKELLENHDINYDTLELAFYKLCNKDQDVYNIGISNVLNDLLNYNLYKYTGDIFNNYSDSFGKINSLEKFQKKYTILKSCYDVKYGEILTISPNLVNFFSSVKKDFDSLIYSGVRSEEIISVLNDLKINLDMMFIINDFSSCFTKDKNKSAIALYEFYKKYPDLYYKLFKSSYGMIFDHFSETAVNINEKNLYDDLDMFV